VGDVDEPGIAGVLGRVIRRSLPTGDGRAEADIGPGGGIDVPRRVPGVTTRDRHIHVIETGSRELPGIKISGREPRAGGRCAYLIGIDDVVEVIAREEGHGRGLVLVELGLEVRAGHAPIGVVMGVVEDVPSGGPGRL
jgi:hypothetical protein